MEANGLLLRLREHETDGSPAERNISRFVQHDPQRAVSMSARELAAATFSSPSTVVRLCKKLGYAGYKEFQRELLLELALMGDESDIALEDIKQGDDISHIIRKVVKSDIQSIEATSKMMEVEIVERCISMMRDARVVDIFGIGASRLVAHDLAQKLARIDKESHSFQDTHDQILCAENMHADDLAIVFSYSGRTAEMLECARLAHVAGAPVIAVTRMNEESEIALIADCVLGIAASEPIMRSGAMASRMAQMAVVDILYAAYVAEDYERSTDLIRRNYIEKG